jgi:anti-sigma factor RsiW
MSSCEAVGKQLPLLLYGELTFDEEEALHQHIESCPGCQSELTRVSAMHRKLDEAEVDVNPAFLTNCRRNLRLATAAISEQRPSSSWLRWNWFGKPLGALIMLAMGFFGGQMLPKQFSEQSPVASRVRFVEAGAAGQVQIVLEETRQKVLSGDMADDDIRALLLRATRESSDPGVRVGTMDLLKGQSGSEEVRRALLHALKNDPNAGVRLKALEALQSSAAREDTQRVLADVLLNDDNPGVRTQAVDLLTQKEAPEMVGVLQEIMTREDNQYVRMKVQRALADMNASAETF